HTSRRRRKLYDLPFIYTDVSTPALYTLSLHDALPIYAKLVRYTSCWTHNNISISISATYHMPICYQINFFILLSKKIYLVTNWQDRKSTRLNSSHVSISYAVFCLKKKKKINSTN